ncbi:MAG: hypothetical protein ACQEP8_02940 [Chlamydiota bacterium]
MKDIIFNLSWVFVALSLLGNYFVIQKKTLGQWLWATSNIGWIAFNVYMQAWSAAFLFSVYFCLCVWGIITWTKDAKREAAAEKVSS